MNNNNNCYLSNVSALLTTSLLVNVVFSIVIVLYRVDRINTINHYDQQVEILQDLITDNIK